MRVNLNCSPKASIFAQQQGLTVFKGDAQPTEIKSQPDKDTFVKSEKPAPAQAPAEPSTTEAKPATTPATAPEVDPKTTAKCEGPNCKDCK